MVCKFCKGKESWHAWKQKPYCSPFCKRQGQPVYVGGTQEWSRAVKTDILGNEQDIEQPMRYDGTFNPRFVAAHGTESIEKNFKVKKQDILAQVEKYG